MRVKEKTMKLHPRQIAIAELTKGKNVGNIVEIWKMNDKESIFILKGNTPFLGWTEIASHDVPSLQTILTHWLRACGNRFIFKMLEK